MVFPRGGGMRVIAFANQKGGVAKTTTVANLGAALGRRGRKVLVIDFDPQANLTEGLRGNPDQLEQSIYDVLVGDTPLKSIIANVEANLDLAVSDINLSGAEAELLQLPGRDVRLKGALKGLRGYDYVLIDCPPSLGQLTLNALTAAKEVVIPLQAEYYALKGLRKLLSTIDMIHTWTNKELQVAGVLVTKYDHRKTLNRDVLEQLKSHSGQHVFNTVIRDNVSLAEAPSIGKHIYHYKSRSYGAEDYAMLCDEIIKQENRL
jgi:chromosome partitioning protein